MPVLLEKREAGGFVREGAFYNGSAGCVPMVFLFAADASEDNSLMKYYAQSLGFCPQKELGTSKPWYDWTCTFMSLDITKISILRKKYFNVFNGDKLPFEYADLDGLFLK